jgi:hypothetical protein
VTVLGSERQHRRFTLIVEATSADTFALHLDEHSNGDAMPGRRISADPLGVQRVLDSVLVALRESKIPRTAVSAQRRKPLALAESAGVRLALVLLATAPITKRERVAAVQTGVQAMSTEEAYYWYAKLSGKQAARASRALRILLADE